MDECWCFQQRTVILLPTYKRVVTEIEPFLSLCSSNALDYPLTNLCYILYDLQTGLLGWPSESYFWGSKGPRRLEPCYRKMYCSRDINCVLLLILAPKKSAQPLSGSVLSVLHDSFLAVASHRLINKDLRFMWLCLKAWFGPIWVLSLAFEVEIVLAAYEGIADRSWDGFGGQDGASGQVPTEA